jgi:hypothetical protein
VRAKLLLCSVSFQLRNYNVVSVAAGLFAGCHLKMSIDLILRRATFGHSVAVW